MVGMLAFLQSLPCYMNCDLDIYKYSFGMDVKEHCELDIWNYTFRTWLYLKSDWPLYGSFSNATLNEDMKESFDLNLLADPLCTWLFTLIYLDLHVAFHTCFIICNINASDMWIIFWAYISDPLLAKLRWLFHFISPTLLFSHLSFIILAHL